MIEQQYRYLEYHGRCIFNAVYDQETQEEDFRTQELIRELLQVFQTGILSVIRNDGTILNIEVLVAGVRSAIFHGVFSEATQLSESQKQIDKDSQTIFPVRQAVDRSREKIGSILAAFAAKGTDAAIAYVNRLLKESANESSMFKKQAGEALRKHQASEDARKKSNQRLAEAVQKFQTNRHMLIEKQGVLEEEKARLLSEKNHLTQEIDKAVNEAKGTLQKNSELRGIIEERNTALLRANTRIQTIEAELARGKKASDILTKIDKDLQSIAKDGNNGPERLRSILSELEELRKQQEKFASQNVFYAQLFKRFEETKALNEVLIRDLETQKKLTKQARVASLLDGSFNTDEHIIDGYYHILGEYFALSLREYQKEFKDHSALESSTAKLRELFFLIRSRGLNPLQLGEERLKEIKKAWKIRNDLQEYNLSQFIIEGIYREVVNYLSSLIQNNQAISAYENMASMGPRNTKTGI